MRLTLQTYPDLSLLRLIEESVGSEEDIQYSVDEGGDVRLRANGFCLAFAFNR